MDPQFADRPLTCSDCQSEFIFTAGEQFFFYDKQFKNDPKRCKPCKARRAGLAAAAEGSNPAVRGLSRTETRAECSECRINTTVPFKPTQGRPVLCRRCFQIRTRALAAQQAVAAQASPHAAALQSPSPAQHKILAAVSARDVTAVALTGASQAANGDHLSPDLATLASACMAAASPDSSVATAADLASISAPLAWHTPEHAFSPGIAIPAVFLACPAETLAAAGAENMDA